MKISYNWLKQYLSFSISPEITAQYLTDCGLEVEGMEIFETIRGGLKGLLIGQVLTCEKHPDSDHLSITTVNVGGEQPLHIVCGAPNVAQDQKVVVATIGTVLYHDDEPFTIKKSKIRGALSEGMICAEDEIGIGNSHDGIMILPDTAIPGMPASNYFNIETDCIFEIGLTPNRSDAISHYGVARDLHAILKINQIPCSSLILPKDYDFTPKGQLNSISITIENSAACPRYTGMTFDNVVVKDSPEWLKNRLKSIGVRPVNNIVDITQYVMFELGQPLHAFDADKIVDNKVIVKNLPEGTPFVTLDGTELKLSNEDLMICNSQEGMCIAGVYGGQNSGVSAHTTRLFLESAYFNPTSIRKTSKRHGIKTDASFRFERGCDPEITVYAIRRAAKLIQELADANITSEIIDIYPSEIERPKIPLRFDHINKVAGKEIDKQIVSSILLLLGMEVKSYGDEQLMITIPLYKNDVTRPIDLIEEILRIYGYNNIEIPSQLSYNIMLTPQKNNLHLQKIISTYLADSGFFEVVNNSLTKAEYAAHFDFINNNDTVKILNPISNELNVLRQTLLFSGLGNIVRNQNNKISNLKLFEFGKVYQMSHADKNAEVTQRFTETEKLALFVTGNNHEDIWNDETRDLDLFYLKNVINNLLTKFNFPTDKLTISLANDAPFNDQLVYQYDGITIANLGRVDTKILQYFSIKKDVYYAEITLEPFYSLVSETVTFKPLQLYPAVKRDLALVVNNDVTYQSLEQLAFKYGTKLLKSVTLFDVYQGDQIGKGKKSYALNFVLQHPDKTLTEEDITKTMNKLIAAFEREVGATLR